MEYDNPFLSYPEQVEKLENEHGLVIENVGFATKALQTFSYHDLINGYKEVFMQKGKYITGVTPEFLFEFHLFDKEFQGILFRQSVFIERIFKSHLSYVMAKNFGVDIADYLNKKHYEKGKSGNKQNQVLSRLSNQAGRIYSTDPVKHYNENKNHIPPWILLKNVYFGDTIDLFTCLKKEEKKEIIGYMLSTTGIEYDETVNFITRALRLIKKFRNIIAHNGKFVNCDIKINVPRDTLQKLAPKEFTHETSRESITGSDLYTMFLSIIILLNNDYLRERFVKNIQKIDYFDIRIDSYVIATHMPQNFIDRLFLYVKSLENGQ